MFFRKVELSVALVCSLDKSTPLAALVVNNLYSVQALLFLQEEYVACHQIIAMALDKDYSDSNFAEADNTAVDLYSNVETVYSN